MIAADLPNRRVEAWKYSDLRAALGDAALPIESARPVPIISAVTAERFGAPVVEIGENEIRTPDCFAAKAEFGELIGWIRRPPPTALSAAFAGFADARLRIVPAVEPSSPAIMLHRSAMHSWVEYERDSNSGSLIEVYSGGRSGFSTATTEIVLSEGAMLDHVIIAHHDSDELVRVITNVVALGIGARYRQFILTTGAKLQRIETHVKHEQEGSVAEVCGAYMTGPGAHADLTSVIEHKAGGGQTRQLIKGVARKGGRGVFQGKIVVAPHAQKTDARQHHHGLLLEDGAEIFAKPELMIHADDVQCAHGNAAGGLDESALFYMRARGLPEAEARALLIEAFLLEAIPDWTPEAVRGELEARIRAWLRSGAP